MADHDTSRPTISNFFEGRRQKDTFRFGLLFLGMFLCCGAALALAPHRHSMKHFYQKQVEALERQWRVAALQGDVPAMDRLLSDDFIGITANGTVQTKAETLDSIRTHDVQFNRLDLSEMKASIHGDTAVVTSKAEVDMISGGQPVKGTFRYTRVYLRKAGVWKVINFEATRITPRAERRTADAPAK